VIGLVDQAVKSLCEIWQPNHIPEVFLTSSRVTVIPSKSSSSLKHEHERSTCFHTRNMQLPSPISPHVQRSPNSQLNASSSSPSVGSASDSSPNADQDARSTLVPLKGFVHEVLRRSRTSGNVLQTALCYLEAIRSKVPELVKQEEEGGGLPGESEGGQIIKAEDLSDAEAEALGMSVSLDSIINTDNCASAKQTDDTTLATVLCTDISNDAMDVFSTSFSDPPVLTRQYSEDERQSLELLAKKHNKGGYPPLPPLPPLPSPLLCPRRAFLAALILASKFTQDRCYSNKAWAKLSGLPPREIGRCERALGAALDWRLWVGKTPTSSSTMSCPQNSRVVVRSRSDGDLLPKVKAPGSSKKAMKTLKKKEVELFGYPRDWDVPCQLGAGHQQCVVGSSGGSAPTANSRSLATLRRSATLPADIFSIDQSSIPIPGPYYSQPDPPPEPPGCEVQMSHESKTVVDVVDRQPHCLSPSTPSLSFSPASTESNSDGDRTIQISSFIDVSTPPPPSDIPVGNQKVAMLPSIVHGCGLSPADPASTYPPPLSYHCGTTFHDPMDYIDQLYAY
jgi:hypothetical protein